MSMADISRPPPPGRDTRAAYCVNCGHDGHWAFACPEPTRAVPAGVRAATGGPGQGGGHRDKHHGRRSNAVITKYQPPNSNPGGMVVTRYAPPPSQHGAPPPPPQPFQAAHHPYPPYGQGPRDHYGPPPPPPPPPPTSWESSYPPPAPGHYAAAPAYPPHPGPSHYSNPGAPLPPPSWPHAPPVHHPPPYGPPSTHHDSYPRPPPPSSAYSPPVPPGYPPPPPSYSHPPPPPPPPQASYHSNLPPPPPPPLQGHAPYGPPVPPVSHSPPSFSGPSRPSGPPPGLPPRPPSPSRHFRDKHGRHKGKKNHRGSDRKEKQNQKVKDRRESQSDHQDRARKEPTPPILEPSPQLAPGSPVQQGDSPPAEEEFDWEFRTIFQEPETHQADEIGKPLPPPAQWHEGVILPRAWDAQSIDSEFLKDKYRDVFNSSIRSTRFWKYLRYDPIFWVDGQGPESKAQPQVQAKPSFEPKPQPLPQTKSSFKKTPQEILGRPAPIILGNIGDEPDRGRKRPHTEDESPRAKDSSGNHGRDRDGSRHTPPQKRIRPEHHSHSSRDRSRDAYRYDARQEQRNHRAPQPDERNPADTLLRALESSRREEDEFQHGSAHKRYRSPSAHRAENTRRRQSPITPSAKDRPESCDRSGHSSAGSRAGSPRSVASGDSADSGEELSWLEAELLGRPIKADKDKEEDDSRRRQKKPQPKRRSAPQINSVYGRRW